jgi:hypothetical protein
MGIETFLLIVLLLLAYAAYLGLRYLLLRMGVKDNNYGGVQHAPKLPPPPPPPADFLPGSRSGAASAADSLQRVMNEGLQVETGSRRKLRRPSRRDLIRSYLVETLIDKPKWKDL